MQTQDAVKGSHNFLEFSQLSLMLRWKYKYVNKPVHEIRINKDVKWKTKHERNKILKKNTKRALFKMVVVYVQF